jgi:hypothetical protein
MTPDALIRVLFSDGRKERTWYLCQIADGLTEDAFVEITAQYRSLKNRVSSEAFVTKIHRIYHELTHVLPMLCAKFKDMIVTDCTNTPSMLTAILTKKAPFDFKDDAAYKLFIVGLSQLDHAIMTKEFIFQIHERLLELFSNRTPSDIREITSLLMCIYVIPNLTHSEYMTNIDTLKHAVSVLDTQVGGRVKDIICSNWRKLFNTYIQDKMSPQDVIQFLRMACSVERDMPFVDLESTKQKMWCRQDIKVWNKWINSGILALYNAFDKSKFDDLSFAIKHIYGIPKYDIFMVDYHYNLRKRLKTLVFMPINSTLQSFQCLFNIEAVMIDAMGTKDVYELWHNNKVILKDAIYSYYLNQHVLCYGQNTKLMLNSVCNDQNVDIIIPPEIDTNIETIQRTYREMYPHRTLDTSYKQSLVTLKDEDVIISGTLIPMSVLFMVAQQGGACDVATVESQMIPAQTKNNKACVAEITKAFTILKQNGLLINNHYVKPRHNIILKEAVKLAKEVLPIDVTLNRRQVLQCYIVKCAKTFKNTQGLTEDEFYRNVCNMLTLFMPTKKEFMSALNICTEREYVEKSGDYYKYM